MSLTTTPVLTVDELLAITGYQRPGDQLSELHRQGFHRARRSPVSGRIILERPHFDAVCVGAHQTSGPKVRVPQVRPR